MPLPSDPTWLKKFNAAIGDPDPDVQKKLAKSMQLTYRCGVGELIWAMTTTCPDLAYASVKFHTQTAVPTNTITTGSNMHFNIFMLLAPTDSTSGVPPLDLNSKKGLSLESIASNKTSSST